MTSSQPLAALQVRLFALAGAVIAIDLAWFALGHFQVDMPAYLRLAAMGAVMLALGLYYQIRRREPALAAMALGAAFLILFSMAAGLLNYFLLTVAGPRIDRALEAADRALGFDWYATMLAMADRPLLNLFFFNIYNAVLPEIALVLVALAWSGRAEKVYRYCLAIGMGAVIAIGFWTLLPSLGAKSLYTLPPRVAAHMVLTVDTGYGKALVALLRDGPGFITPSDLRGLIAFPSYHGVLALLVAFHAWPLRWLRWPLVALNAAVLVTTPVQGGHHLVDVLGAFPVAALAVWIAGGSRAGAAKAASVVNKPPKFTTAPVPQALFRASAEQDGGEAAPAIKLKLSAAP